MFFNIISYFLILKLVSSSSVFFLDKRVLSSSINNVKPCSKCKWFIKNEHKDDLEDGYCEIFLTNQFLNSNFYSKYKHVFECRSNNLLCGINGYYFEPKTNSFNQIKNDPLEQEEKNKLKELNYLREKMIEMEEQNCGEVNEKYDLDNWDLELKQIKIRIEKIINSLKKK
jgi:hypothetical protein